MKTVDIGKYNTMAAFGLIILLPGLLDPTQLSQNQFSLLVSFIGFTLFSVAMYKYSKIFQNSHIMKNYLIAVGLFFVYGFFSGLWLATVIASGHNTPEKLINLITNISIIGMYISLIAAFFFIKNTLLELYKHLKHRLFKITSWIYFGAGVTLTNLLGIQMIFIHSNIDIKENPLFALTILVIFIASILLVIAFFKVPDLVEVPE
jgi:uncharacterized membrane protein